MAELWCEIKLSSQEDVIFECLIWFPYDVISRKEYIIYITRVSSGIFSIIFVWNKSVHYSGNIEENISEHSVQRGKHELCVSEWPAKELHGLLLTSDACCHHNRLENLSIENPQPRLGHRYNKTSSTHVDNFHHHSLLSDMFRWRSRSFHHYMYLFTRIKMYCIHVHNDS